jgi:8-oxo-dGTP pyrophosphatase MutT (NUDIX family)
VDAAGGGVEQGEHPDDTVVREFAEETGLTVA